MKVINREQFLNLPSGVVYSQYASMGMINGLYQKGDSWINDWLYVDLIGDVDASNDIEFSDFFEEVEKGLEFNLDYESGRRDGLFNEDAMFMVYDKTDLASMIGKLCNILNKDYNDMS